MAGNLFVFPRQIGFDGPTVQPGSKLTFTQTETTTPQDTFTDVALTIANSNPVIADANGVFAAIYFNPSFVDYRVKFDDTDDVLIYQVDGIPASQAGQTLTLTAAAPFIDLIESDASANNGVWRIGVNSEQLTIQVGNDALSVFVDIVAIDRTTNTVDTVNFKPTTLQRNGVDVRQIFGAEKTANETVNTDIVVSDDADLSFSLAAGTYEITYLLIFHATTTAGMGFQWQLNYTGTTTRSARLPITRRINSADDTVKTIGVINQTTSVGTISTSSGSPDYVLETVSAVFSDTGTLSIQWAQNSSNGDNLNVLDSSYLIARRLN